MYPNPTIKIEPLQDTGIPACARIMLDNPLWHQYGITLESAEMMFRDALAQSAPKITVQTAPQIAVQSVQILAAWVGEEIAGFVWYSARGAWDRSGYVRLIGVSPRYQGQKIGEQLMAAAEEHMAASVQDIFLLVTESNTAAQRFYRRLSYRQVGAIPDYIRPGITELIFHKRVYH